MTDLGAGDRLARLLLPYCRREMESVGGPDHEIGWWFAAAPPEAAREALAVVQAVAGERPNDQPPEEWLVKQAALRGGLATGWTPSPAASGGTRL